MYEASKMFLAVTVSKLHKKIMKIGSKENDTMHVV